MGESFKQLKHNLALAICKAKHSAHCLNAIKHSTLPHALLTPQSHALCCIVHTALPAMLQLMHTLYTQLLVHVFYLTS